MFTAKSIKKHFQQNLRPYFEDREILSIWDQWVVKEILNMSLVEYFSKKIIRLDKKNIDKINLLINHLSSKKPVQYFFGYTYFKDIILNVDKRVLIPRPETEELVDLVYDYAQSTNISSVIDIGTGSGCISIALKKQLHVKMLAVDYCNNILRLAEQNANKHNVDIDFILIDILKCKQHSKLPKVDVIVSNPPYVIRSHVAKESIILSEPSKAIFVNDNNPLIFYEFICRFAKSHLNTGGRIFFEINPKLVSKLKDLIYSFGYSQIKIRQDFYQKKRFIIVSS